MARKKVTENETMVAEVTSVKKSRKKKEEVKKAEVTVIVDARITMIVEGKSGDDQIAPLNDEYKSKLAEVLKKQIGADDVQIKDAKKFVRE